MSIRNSSPITLETFEKPKLIRVGRPRSYNKAQRRPTRDELLEVGIANLMEVFPFGSEPIMKHKASVIHMEDTGLTAKQEAKRIIKKPNNRYKYPRSIPWPL